MYFADTLSRAYLTTTDRSPTEKEVERIHAVDFLAISEPQLPEIQQETATDPVLQSLTQVILKGWPEKKDDLPMELHPYFDVRDELTAQDGVLFKGLRCLVPSSLRPKICERLHGAHSGIESCLRRAREVVYWPGMPAEIKDYISKCEICASYKKELLKEPLISYEIPSRPWETFGVDIFHFDSGDYLCTVDYYSSYFEMDSLKDKTAREVIHTLTEHFSRHGIPSKLMSDNGPPLNSHDFLQFATNYDREHVTSSLHYPQSNGKVENTIKTAKCLLNKSKAARSDIYLVLLEWRNTPSEGLQSSPAQRMFGRRTRTLIPTTSQLLKPKIVEEVPDKLFRRKQLQAKYYNISAKEPPPLNSEDVVRVKPTDKSDQWYKARVEKEVDVRSYDVRTEDGRLFRRNRRHLRSSREPVGSSNSNNPVTPSIPDITSIAPLSPNEPVPGTSQEFEESPPPKRATETGQPNSSPDPADVSTSSMPLKPVGLPVTRSGRTSTQPSHLKDFVVSK
ncbi:uncharacterized protein K02A2.6-like [Stylophora pistillata]|uniref:uncharacterized protein K02A2.6-like n=1 Tax=Stylophora pistillata TaxID=50429 RepID=UPI000C038BDE|nr:uncharacterized protein K02A2.6-like [Stylophora pistillata]